MVGERLDNGFLGIGQSLKDMMMDLINHVAQFFENPKVLPKEIEELKDISEYNSYMRQKIDESAMSKKKS
jgi:hypothetical protein